ncbi:hypothetical protein GCM10008018_30890 [Paenibacillus marchantiophytorum]|uniref:Uncharacterized protein n=2 Tax=Paenibacillus marchantiophytorum TaxID=1619310 RepID=A0ABQ1ERE0_9BACL|nr:hypothetical protein GCM10008018_30890 [Paenibacillus marchantiophytorum]
MKSSYNDSRDIQTLNVVNLGILDFLLDNSVIEANCVLRSGCNGK